jgi:hypothetical protein
MAKTLSTVPDEEPKTAQLTHERRTEANQLLGAGLGLGALGAVSAIALGATCPLCVVVAPAMLGMGIYKRLRGGTDR